MAIDLTGISNEGEFYSAHYLQSLLENDIKSAFSGWEEQPWRALRRLTTPYFERVASFQNRRSNSDRLSDQRRAVKAVLSALGYTVSLQLKQTESAAIPLLVEVTTPSGAPLLWIVEAFGEEPGEHDLLELPIHPEQTDQKPTKQSLADLLNAEAFFQREPPRWVIVVSISSMLLLDRSKWSGRRALRFDLREILSRRETSTLQATAALLHRDCICRKDGTSLLDTLDEQSHKHAYEVSEDLKYALRESVELLGNEAVRYIRHVQKKGGFRHDLADTITLECLRYMYRLLFLLYIEVRPELGYIPLKSDIYRDGYSLDSLRNLEMVRLETDQERSGSFLHTSIRRLFSLIYDGFSPAGGQLDHAGIEHNQFAVPPLKCHLFDPDRTKNLDSVQIPNHVWLRIIRRMSFTQAKKKTGRRKSKQGGRISYSHLGINQLGAVYEALLSYRGFIAEHDLYEVKRKRDSPDVLAQAYFVKAEALEEYDDDERVYNDDGSLVCHRRGSFIYRLAGRDREASASYYTPEVLTKCVVQYALRELLVGKSADELLTLTICEPAMGSAAFINEAVSQLADVYLKRKQKELSEALPPDLYADEKQKLKMYLADNNVYGVDLNPVAVELAEVSLWLNTLVPGGFVPWFGNQLKCANSLVGARHHVYSAKSLSQTSWWTRPPHDVPVAETRPMGSVYHFLVGDAGMANYKDKVIKSIAGDHISRLGRRRKAFTKPHSPWDIKRLGTLSDTIDGLWKQHTAILKRIDYYTTDDFAIYGQPEPTGEKAPTTTREKDAILQRELTSRGVANANPYRRLKLVMDYWCALWFWPIEDSQLFPTRHQYLSDVDTILIGHDKTLGALAGEPLDLLPAMREECRDSIGFVDIDRLIEASPRLRIVKRLSDSLHFHHWHLEFADQFADRGGFDLVLGNPPWIRTQWREAGVLADVEPLYAIRKYSASKMAVLRRQHLESRTFRSKYIEAYTQVAALQAFLRSAQNYPLLKGMQTNLYKNFLCVSWMLSARVTGLLHPEGVYDDNNGGLLREVLYRRLRWHFQFSNALKLFSEVHNQIAFGVNVYGPPQEPAFATMANLFTPSTIDASLHHDGRGPIPGVKNTANRWDLRGHKDRCIMVTREELTAFADLYDEDRSSPTQARLPAIHSSQLLEALLTLSKRPNRLSTLDDWHATEMWNETNAQKDGTIQRDTRFQQSASELILSGPHFFVGNAFYKTPNRDCRNNVDYSILDLTILPSDYRPRTNYVRACSRAEYRTRTARVRWNPGARVSDFYRICFREMIGPASERTLIPAVMSPDCAHIDTVMSVAFRRPRTMINALQTVVTVVSDSIVKATGKSHIGHLWSRLPSADFSSEGAARILGLVCLTADYADLWNSFCTLPASSEWSKCDTRLTNDWFKATAQPWSWSSPLRTDYARRQALVELDVLHAQSVNLTLEQLQAMYRIQFPVLRHYESETWYDTHGRIVFTTSKGLPGVGLPRKGNSKDRRYGIRARGRSETNISLGWEDVRYLQRGIVTKTFMDDTLPGGPVERTVEYHAPFDRCDREDEYAQAWEHFTRRKALGLFS